VALGADGAVRLARPAAVDPAGWRALPGVLPCANHDIAAAVVGEHVYVVGGALWWRGFPAREHMFDEVRPMPCAGALHGAWRGAWRGALHGAPHGRFMLTASHRAGVADGRAQAGAA
jgi:hypothetical protein